MIKHFIAILLICCLTFFSWSSSAEAVTRIDPKLEEQVLEIIRNHPESIIESVQAYQQQQQQKLEQIRQAFLTGIKTNPAAIIGDSPQTGAQDFKIVLLEFSDFQCPFCAQAYQTVKQFMAKHKNEVTLAYKHFPLAQIHPQAIPAAQAAWAAQQQGKFWQYHDALFEHQEALGEDLYISLAKSLNLDLDKFNQDRQLALMSIQKDMAMANGLGINGTPFFIMSAPGFPDGSEALFSGAISLSDFEKKLNQVKGL